ncbi:hypothetical protein Peur_005843 [Populus x canadensis]
MIASYYKLLAQMWKGYKKQNVMVLDQVDQCHANTRFSRSHCGHVVNKMPSGRSNAASNCDAEAACIFHLKITLADETGKMFSLDEQFMYPSSPENESFIDALVNCQRHGYGICRQGITQEADAIRWEITRALRCE